MSKTEIKFAFFGTPKFAKIVLDELEKSGFIPSIIITTPDKPQGRKMILTPPPVKIWAEERNIPVLQPDSLNSKFQISNLKFDLFIVASYGKIIPKEVLEIPQFGSLNVHPSLLPKLRGASPIESAILEENKTGVSIMLIDEKMDHGPIVSQKEINIEDWPPYFEILEEKLAIEGGKLLSEVLPLWISKKIEAKEQDHSQATFTKKIKKEDGLIDLNDDPEKNIRKIRAFSEWPGSYFFIEHKGKKIRILIKKASIVEGQLVLEKVLPEGKKEISYEEFKRGYGNYLG